MDKKIPSFLIVSRYSEDVSWIDDYTQEYIIYNRGEFIREDSRIISVPNEGGNQKDIFRFIIENYGGLPETMAFIQAYPWDHCEKEIFDKIIYNNYFTSIEYYGMNPANGYERRSENGGFVEINNNWYIHAHNASWGLTCRYNSFDEFMNKYFSDYRHLDWIRFTPGSQYIVEKKQILNYSLKFWKLLFDELEGLRPTEGHIIERALWHIFNGNYKLKEEYI